MPNRILRSWTDSVRFDGISAEAERLFVRLLMVADDYGRYHAEHRLIRAGCFPLLNLRATDVDRWLDELSTRQLVLRYEVGGRPFLSINNFNQRLKQSKAKFPPPPGTSDDWVPSSGDFPELPGSSRNFPPDSETETETDSDPDGSVSDPPDGGPNGHRVSILDQLWRRAPKKGRERSSRRQLANAWSRIPAGERPPDTDLLEALERWKQGEKWTRDGGDFVEGIHRWIGNRAWRDVPEPAESPKPRKLEAVL